MPTIVFVCQHGVAKSVLAAAELERLAAAAGIEVTARAVGTEPDEAVSPALEELLPRESRWLAGHRPQLLSPASLEGATRVVTLGLEPGAIDRQLGSTLGSPATVERWDDVPSVSEAPQAARDAIDRHVTALIAELSSPRPSPLVSVDALVARPGDARLVIVDTRWYLGRPGEGRAAYDAGHIPGAVHLDLDADLADPQGFGAPGRHPLPDPGAFAARMAAIGIGDDTLVVAYDDAGGWVASRLWWMLDNLGHRGGEAVLDGGWQAWLAAGHPTSTVVPTPVPAAGRALHLGQRWTRVIARDELAARLGRLTLLDARAAPRYRGETEPVDPVAGHIPTAINAPWDANLGSDGRFLPREDLRRRFAALEAVGPVTAGGAIVISCGSGTSACHHAVAMRLAGLPDPTLYVGSYSDWTRSGLPVATGPEPGTPPPELLARD